MKRLLLIEPFLSGHHFRLLNWIADEALARGWLPAVVTDPASASHPALKALADRGGDALTVHVHPFANLPRGAAISTLLRRELAYRRHFVSVFRAIHNITPVDLVVLPYADYCLHALALAPDAFDGVSWAGVAMRPAFHCHAEGLTNVPPSILTRFKERLFLRLATARPLAGLVVIDPCLARYVAERRPLSRIHYVQDPVNLDVQLVPRDEARRRLGLPINRPLVLVYGSIEERKGVRELLAAQFALPRGERPHVVVAGRVYGPKTIFATSPADDLIAAGDLTVLNRFITDDEESLLFSACDAVWVGYRGHLGSSGALWQAVVFQRPVLACKEGLIGWFTRHGALGRTLEMSDPKNIAAALCALPMPYEPNPVIVPLAGQAFAACLLDLAAKAQ